MNEVDVTKTDLKLAITSPLNPLRSSEIFALGTILLAHAVQKGNHCLRTLAENLLACSINGVFKTELLCKFH